ncbi:HD domain-containing protein [Loigolactobacillus backii]|uniref:Hydrolase n=1 Tax=Loigolactobacillus backii TaxID=375175 RepID=A0A192H397_9LACO|nr:HD domain-containing protein [Loigolactobacillus backii]ANK59320.1 hydrolase [Loigolactobacillus backii]ANK62733.1 hydrolase [Loigolactobacillus backii]ANK64312.1 hydrolase [Loigolactobacillus backii]ANK67293.1 hydrolase [Loigolactobacillus backii]ANK70259.1 hydrolase [Loigolactobacillus backii]
MKKTLNWQDDQAYVNEVADLLETDAVKRLADYTQHHFSNRLEHSIHVSYRSYLIAKRLKLDTRATARGGLLHDLFYYDWRTTKFDLGTHAYIHPRIALRNAEKLTQLSKKEKDIIIKHMWGATVAPPRYPESLIVSVVDDYCAIDEYAIPEATKLRQSFKQRVLNLTTKLNG